MQMIITVFQFEYDYSLNLLNISSSITAITCVTNDVFYSKYVHNIAR